MPIRTLAREAIPSAEKLKKGDMNPKDHILVQRSVYDIESYFKDNTGERQREQCLQHRPKITIPLCTITKNKLG